MAVRPRRSVAIKWVIEEEEAAFAGRLLANAGRSIAFVGDSPISLKAASKLSGYFPRLFKAPQQ